MKKIINSGVSIFLVILLAFGTLALSSSAEGFGAPLGGGMGGGNSSPSFSGANTITSSTKKSGVKYSSSTGSENALLVSGGSSSLSNITVTKSGNSSDENADFYGTNAAILAYNGAMLNISGSKISTNGSHANAVFAYSDGTINISNSTIKTKSNNSGAVMVTGGGTLTATNVTAETDGNSSAPIRSDRGGGTLTVNGGRYTSNGTGSPAVYSTADITVNNAKLNSTASEGVVVEGANSVTLNSTTVTDNNTTLNGNSETYKNIFLYQSMSGDADEGNATFSAKDSTLITKNGDTFFVTNTTAVINLTNTEITNEDSTGAFLRIQAGKWGNSGSNGGNVTLNASNQTIDGDIVADSISTLAINLTSSEYTGAINSKNSAKNISLKLDSTSSISLTGDTYVTSLENAVSDNSNINLNGFTLYVNGKAITSTNYKQTTTQTTTTTTTQAQPAQSQQKSTKTPIIIACTAAVLIITGAATVIIKKKKGVKVSDTKNIE